jgi:malate synthase
MPSGHVSDPAAGRELRGFEPNRSPEPIDLKRDLPAGFIDFYLPLHQRFTGRQQKLLAKRKVALEAAHAGRLPNHLPPSRATRESWMIELPEWAKDQRNQMTGPADDAELVVKMLNSGAPGVMLDLEDSMANTWQNLELGIANVLAALKGELTYFDKKRDKQVGIQPSPTVIFTRARGLHISQRLHGLDAFSKTTAAEFGDGDLTSASLYDVCRIVFSAAEPKLKHPLCFYIPKSESAEEAVWWAELFDELEAIKGWAPGTIRCMALVESHSLAYQIEEFLYNLSGHIIGLNLGRWDYMASLIHFNFSDARWVLPDRNTIPHDVRFFQNLRMLIPAICHRHGCLAIGGMTALYPDRSNKEFNDRALAVLAQDKKNESVCGMDGAWTGHPDQNQIAVDQFPFPNQIEAHRPDLVEGQESDGGADGIAAKVQPRYPDLRPQPTGVGKRTLAGTRAAIRTVIRYRNGVLNGKGASLLDGYMEDLATDRIYRLMIAQRMKHSDIVEIADDSGGRVLHTPELISRLFDEELEKILASAPAGEHETYRRAREISESMVRNEEFDPH